MRITRMKRISQLLLFLAMMFAAASAANAGKYQDTIALFKNAGESAAFFKNSYAYAVFPNIGEAGLLVGGAFGRGRVYVQGQIVRATTKKPLSDGFQVVGKDFHQIIFFQCQNAPTQLAA